MGCGASAEKQEDPDAQPKKATAQEDKYKDEVAADDDGPGSDADAPPPKTAEQPPSDAAANPPNDDSAAAAAASGAQLRPKPKPREPKAATQVQAVQPSADPKIIVSLTGTAFASAATDAKGATAGKSRGAAPVDASPTDTSVVLTAWSGNERYQLAADAAGGVSCWAAFVPYALQWRTVLPREPRRMSAPTAVAVLLPHQSDMTGVLVVDSHGHLWRLDMGSGHALHLACVLPEGIKPSPTMTARCASMVPLPSPAQIAGKTPPPVNVLMLVGLSKGTVTSFVVSFQPLEAVDATPSKPAVAGVRGNAAPQPAPAFRIVRAFTLPSVGMAGGDVAAISCASLSPATSLSLETRAAAPRGRAANPSGAEAAVSAPVPQTTPIVWAVATQDGDVALLQHAGGVPVDVTKPDVLAQGLCATTKLQRAAARVQDGVQAIHAVQLTCGDGAAAMDSEVLSAPVGVFTLDTVGNVALWRCVQKRTDAAAVKDDEEAEPTWPLAQRRIEATSMALSNDRRQLLCGVPRHPDDLLPPGASAKRSAIATVNDVIVLDVGAALDTLAADATTSRGMDPALRLDLPSIAALQLPTILGADVPDCATTTVSCVSQSINRLMLLVGTSGGGVIIVDFSAHVKPERLMHHRGNTVAALSTAGGGKYGVSASEDTTLRAWELLSGRPLCVMDAHVGRVWAVAAAKGLGVKQRPAGARGGGAAGGKAASNPAAVAMANWVVSGAEDGTMRVWSLPAGRLVETHEVGDDCVWSVASEGGFVFAGLSDGRVRMYCLAADKDAKMTPLPTKARAIDDSGDPLHQQQTEGASASDAFVAPPAASFARFTGRNGGPQRKPGQTAAQVKKLAPCGILMGHTAAVTAIHATPYTLRDVTDADGTPITFTLVVTGSMDGTVRVWDAAAETCLAVITGHADVVWGVTTNCAFHESARGAPPKAAEPTTPPPVAADDGTAAADDTEKAAATAPATVAEDPPVPPLMVYTASEDKTLRAWALHVDACVEHKSVEVEAANRSAGAATPATAGSSLWQAWASQTTSDPAASVAMLDANVIACGTGVGDLLVAEATSSIGAAANKGPLARARARKAANPGTLRWVLEAHGVHESGSSLCALASARQCLLSGGVDGVIRYHEPWPALKAELTRNDQDRAAMLRETRSAKVVLARPVDSA